MKKAFFYYFAIMLLYSCKNNNECEINYIGLYKIDSGLMKSDVQRKFLEMYEWDKIVLTSHEDGKYEFNKSDPLLKEAEGRWYVKSSNIEGECFGYVVQNNLDYPFIRDPFDIMVIINDSVRFSLPFRKMK